MLFRTRRTILAFVALMGCGGDGPTEPPIALAPRYVAVSAGGASLPAVVQEEPYRDELLAGTLEFATDGTCTLALDVRTTEVDRTRHWRYGGECTYTPRADGVRLDVERIGPMVFHATGDRLNMPPGPGGGVEIVFAPTTES